MSTDMQGIIYEEVSVWQFVLVTCLLGGAAAWMTGRACALTWRPFGRLLIYLALLGVGVRFMHHALFAGSMLSLHFYFADTAVLLALGTLGYHHARAGQLARQYHWLYERSRFLFFARRK